MLKKIMMLMLVLILIVSLIIFLNYSVETQYKYTSQTDDNLFLVVSSLSKDTDSIQGWKIAAQEIGLHLEAISDQQFLYLSSQNKNKMSGVILADLLHLQVSTALFNALKNYVEKGGNLMLVYDAGTLDDENMFFPDGSPFSKILGFSYAKRSPYRDGNITIESVGHIRGALTRLGVPPGKCVSASAEKSNEIYGADNDFCAISSYLFGDLDYRHFNTEHHFNDQDLLLTTQDHQFIAGVKAFGQGKILFVNLPLTGLWQNTDRMLMYVFLRYFAENLVQSPVLLAVPNGIGGLILNLHVETIAALDGFAVLKEIGLFQQGPYSIDVTAGPGVDTPIDGRGLDVLNNKNTQAWLHMLVNLGHEIGSDGGWLHDYFGTHVNQNNEAEFLPYIEKNVEALERVLGIKVREYMPSMGNQPSWTTRYLEKEGFVAYYSAGNTGSAPTQKYRNGVFDAPTLWAFPILPLGRYACIRDFGRYQVPVEIVRQWFEDATRFVAENRTVRLIYFHPEDVILFTEYLSAIRSWLDLADQLHQARQFQWYTMVNIGEFLNKRRQVSWVVEKQPNDLIIKAQHPVTLSSMTWLIKKTMCKKPIVLEGVAAIRNDRSDWVITAGDQKRLLLQCERIRELQ